MKNDGKNLSEKQLQAVTALLSCPTHKDAAEQLGISRGTVQNWLSIPEFKKELDNQRKQVTDQALDKLKGALNRAIDELIALLDSENIYIRLSVINRIIDYSLKLRETEEFNKRLEEIENIVYKRN